MSKKIRFPLEMADGTHVRTLVELKEHFDAERVVGYYLDGKLQTWLNDRYIEKEAAAVDALSRDDEELAQKLCEIFGVEYLGDLDPEEIAYRNERIARLKQLTGDIEIIKQVDIVAFDQDDLFDRYDEGRTKIILAEGEFDIPESKRDLDYVVLGGGQILGHPNKHEQDSDFSMEQEDVIGTPKEYNSDTACANSDLRFEFDGKGLFMTIYHNQHGRWYEGCQNLENMSTHLMIEHLMPYLFEYADKYAYVNKHIDKLRVDIVSGARECRIFEMACQEHNKTSMCQIIVNKIVDPNRGGWQDPRYLHLKISIDKYSPHIHKYYCTSIMQANNEDFINDIWQTVDTNNSTFSKIMYDYHGFNRIQEELDSVPKGVLYEPTTTISKWRGLLTELFEAFDADIYHIILEYNEMWRPVHKEAFLNLVDRYNKLRQKDTYMPIVYFDFLNNNDIIY